MKKQIAIAVCFTASLFASAEAYTTNIRALTVKEASGVKGEMGLCPKKWCPSSNRTGDCSQGGSPCFRLLSGGGSCNFHYFYILPTVAWTWCSPSSRPISCDRDYAKYIKCEPAPPNATNPTCKDNASTSVPCGMQVEAECNPVISWGVCSPCSDNMLSSDCNVSDCTP